MKIISQCFSIIIFLMCFITGCSTGVTGENVIGREGSAAWLLAPIESGPPVPIES